MVGPQVETISTQTNIVMKLIFVGICTILKVNMLIDILRRYNQELSSRVILRQLVMTPKEELIDIMKQVD